MLALPHLLGACLPSLWSSPSLSPCSRSDPPSLAKMRLSLTLTLSHHTIWYFGQTALFLFLLAKAALVYLPTALSVALGPLFPFQQAQYVQAFYAEACAILHARCWSRQHQQVYHFTSHLFSYVTIALSSSPSFLLPQSLWQELFSLSSCSIRLQRAPGHSFLPGNDAADELARWEALFVPSATPCNLSLFVSRVAQRQAPGCGPASKECTPCGD